MRPAAAFLLIVLFLPRAGAEEEALWIVTLTNGDAIRCRLLAIEGSRLVVRWSVAPEEPLRLDLKAVEQVARAGPKGVVGEPPQNLDVLRLRDDSVLYGRATRVSPLGIAFEMPQVGGIEVPAADILALERGELRVQMPDAEEGEFAVALRSGVALAGRLSTDGAGRLVLEGKGITATIDESSLVALVFPAPNAPEDLVGAAAGQGIEVKLANGSVIGGRDPSLEGGTLQLRTGGVEARLPILDVAALSFRDYVPSGGRSALRRILAWGRWSDPAEEFRRTIDIAKAETGGRWKVAETSTERFDEAFRRDLFGVRTLLIPEMEALKTPSPDAAELKPLLEAFLQTGGNIVVCGAKEPAQLQWLRDAGLVEIDALGSVDGAEVAITPAGASAGKRIKTFQAMNATTAYRIRSTDAVAFAEAAGKAVVVGRRVGRGLVVVVGLDYYMTNEGASRLLGNVIQLR